MDEDRWDPELWIAIFALGGLVRAWSRFHEPQGDDTRISARVLGCYVLAMVAVAAGSYAASWRGFLYLLLMPFGAYKVADLAGSALLLAWYRLRG